MESVYQTEAYQSEKARAEYWQTRAMRAENAIIHARNYLEQPIRFYAEERNWTEGDVPMHIYAHDDKGRYARDAMKSSGWTALGLQWLADGAPLNIENPYSLSKAGIAGHHEQANH